MKIRVLTAALAMLTGAAIAAEPTPQEATLKADKATAQLLSCQSATDKAATALSTMSESDTKDEFRRTCEHAFDSLAKLKPYLPMLGQDQIARLTEQRDATLTKIEAFRAANEAEARKGPLNCVITYTQATGRGSVSCN